MAMAMTWIDSHMDEGRGSLAHLYGEDGPAAGTGKVLLHNHPDSGSWGNVRVVGPLLMYKHKHINQLPALCRLTASQLMRSRSVDLDL